jgi:alpha-ketoglutarate-dependent taurine dioxygenase
VSIDWRRNDGVIIDNWRCLHARMAVERPDLDRLLERMTVE